MKGAAVAHGGAERAEAQRVLRALALVTTVAVAFLIVGGQLIRLGTRGQGQTRTQMAEPVATSFARPDIVDRQGRLLATDVDAHSLYADPMLVLDVDEAIEKLATVLPDIDNEESRRLLGDQSRRFVWLRRGLTPGIAQRVHDLGIPGLSFRREQKRVYPAGRLAGHLLGGVSLDNAGVAGIERYIDETLGLEQALAPAAARRPVRLSIDLGVQHGLEEELAAASAAYRTSGAFGIILDANTGAIAAAASVPDTDPARPAEAADTSRIDRVQVATYELGSVFKVATIAMALELGIAKPDTLLDVRLPLQVGRFLVKDLHPAGRPLTVREVFVTSSNVGAGKLGQMAGAEAQRAFLGKLGLLTAMRTEAGPITPPNLPTRWGAAEVVTISYGHGLAVAPLQFAAAAAALVNGGRAVQPTLIWQAAPASGAQVVSAATSAALRDMMRRNVVQSNGTGRRAEVPGLEIGGKTGTAEIAAGGRYQDKAVVASFLAAFPISAPRYVVLVALIEPSATDDTRGQITAGVNAAPVAGHIIARAAPLLGVRPKDAPKG
jgi:cell division protein FtsI (penicillin-binding protein 3)